MADKVFALKTNEEIEIMARNGRLLGQTHGVVSEKIQPGITTADLDRIAWEFINDNGAKPSFKGFNGFPASLCVSVNDVVVHGIPSDYRLKDGDLVSVDCGVYKDGFHADSAFTYWVGDVSEENFNLLKYTYLSLMNGIAKLTAGNRIGDVAAEIQQTVEAKGYTVVRELVGHGVGRHLHEAPEVPNYGKRGKGPLIVEGMVVAIEPMVNLGRKQIFQERDGWTIRTSDRRPSAHFEHSVAVQDGKPRILTSFDYIKPVFKKLYAETVSN